jgi:acetyl-CoA/propionyl-CoA carboxylase biotin carboxyl carrier protein
MSLQVIRTSVEVDGKLVSLGIPSLLLNGLGSLATGTFSVAKNEPEPSRSESYAIHAPVSGTLRAYKVTNGAYVSEGDLLAVTEAMKMETQIVAPKDGAVRQTTKEGEYLQSGEMHLRFKDPELVAKNEYKKKIDIKTKQGVW